MKRKVAFFISMVLLFSGFALAYLEAPLDKQNRYLAEPQAVQGGEITDGRDLRRIRWGRHPDFERVVLDIYEGAYDEKGPAVSIPCYFVVEYEYYPFRFIVTLGGIRAINAELGEVPQSSLIRETYSLPYLDDSGFKLALALNRPVEYEVFELHEPGRIVIDLRELQDELQLPPVYSLRTETGLGVEDLGYLQEIMLGLESKNPRVIMAGDGKLFFEESYYSSREEAEARKEEIAPHAEWAVFFIEKRGPATMPE